ncbi:MAG: hypothetical protein JOZ62_22095 [Acidobacteriaceae bacterium]|nr:hypothetical protein [Acidobacteriaceae bacterium]
MVAGLAPYLLHAALPNHTYEEYAWIGAPLAYTPLLVAAARGEWLRMQWQAWPRGARGADAGSSELLVTDLSRSVLRHCGSWCMALLLLLCVIGPSGYRWRYRRGGESWQLGQEKIGAKFAASWPQLKSLPDGSRILIAGLETPFLPWSLPDFIRIEFGTGKSWVVLVPGESGFRGDDGFIRRATLADVSLRDADYVATYDDSGQLLNIRRASELSGSITSSAMLIPEIASALKMVRKQPSDRFVLTSAIDRCIRWGAWTDARSLLDHARKIGLRNEPEVLFDEGRVAAGAGNWAEAVDWFERAVGAEPRNQVFRNNLREAQAHIRPHAQS